MTVVIDNGGSDPRVHVLAIGVAGYRHLPEGAEPVAHDTFGLKQLDGPQHSVEAFVQWAQRINHPGAQLGTVEMLVSSAGAFGAAAQPVEVPSLENVKAAFDRWYDRCDEHEDNVSVFYFCGHGVERESVFLLLEDFGKSANRPLENAVDVNTTFRGMAQCKAKEQFFFVDSCREIPFAMLELLDGDAAVLKAPELVGDLRTNTALFFATAEGAKAFGKRGGVTRFTEALVHALDGMGSRPEGGSGWVVDAPNVLRALTRLLREGPDGAPAQVPSLQGAGAGPIHVLAQKPRVPVAIACDPVAAIPSATLGITGATPGESPPVPAACDFGWTLEAPAGTYWLKVDFPGGDFRPHESELPAWPPGLDTRIEVAS